MKRPVPIVARVVVLGCLTLTFQSMARPGADRSVAFQALLALLVLGGPLLSYLLRARRERIRWPLLIAQIGCYVLYETGISIESNIRIDLLLLYPAMLLNAWILFRAARSPRHPAVHLSGSARVTGILGLVVALMGLLESAWLLAGPAVVASYGHTLAAMDAQPQYYFPTPEAQRQAHERMRVPPWFKLYSLGTGAAGLAVSCFYLWGAWRFLRSIRGPRLVMLGCVLSMLVAAGIVAGGLVSSSRLVRTSLGPGIGLLVVNGIILLMLVRRPAARPVAVEPG